MTTIRSGSLRADGQIDTSLKLCLKYGPLYLHRSGPDHGDHMIDLQTAASHTLEKAFEGTGLSGPGLVSSEAGWRLAVYGPNQLRFHQTPSSCCNITITDKAVKEECDGPSILYSSPDRRRKLRKPVSRRFSCRKKTGTSNGIGSSATRCSLMK